MPKLKINHGKIELEVAVLHQQLEEEVMVAVGRYAQRFTQAIDQLIKANPGKLRLSHQNELDLEYPGQVGPNRPQPVQVYRTRYVTNCVYVSVVYDELLMLELSPGPEGNSIRVQFKEKIQRTPAGNLDYPCGRRRWSATVYSFDKVLSKATTYQQYMQKLLADKLAKPIPATIPPIR